MTAGDFSISGQRERDRRLRHRILFVLDVAKIAPKGGMSGRKVFWEVEDGIGEGTGFEDDTHFLLLARDLVNKGLLAEEKLERRRAQPFGPEFLFLRITDKGSMLVREQIPVDPDIWDERMVE